jgi:hypothetical protein
MRRALAIIAVFAGLTWGGMVGWAANVPETRLREEIRTGAFVVLVGFGMLAPTSRRRDSGKQDEEETL